MTVKAATPYLMFNGHATDAIALYERALGARTEALQRFGDVNQSCPAADRNRVMHAMLRVGDAVIMMSDGPSDQPDLAPGNVKVALDFAEPVEMQRAFDALAVSGEVVVPIQDTPWGKFGSLRDTFGVPWMFNHTRPAR